VQLALKRRKQSPGKALEAGTNQVQVAPKNKNSRNLDRAAEAGASPSAGCTRTTSFPSWSSSSGASAVSGTPIANKGDLPSGGHSERVTDEFVYKNKKGR